MNHADHDHLEGAAQVERRRISLGATGPGQHALINAPEQSTR